MKKLVFSAALVALTLGVQSCRHDDDNNGVTTTDNASEVQMVKENYANIVLAGYEDSQKLAIELKNKIDMFVANPSESSFEAAKEAWYAAREPYGQTEAFRFANGPIDSGDNAVEGLLNAWPLDESFIDYVNIQAGPDGDDSNTNIINNITEYPEITKDVLRSLNEFNGNERSISVGYHGIEFLLWGQDTQIPTAGAEHTTGGQRQYTDYTTAENAARRGQYLKLSAEILVEDLTYLVNEWKQGGNNYRATFLAMDNDTALRNILSGAGILAGAELAEERILVAVANESQEDEHSCFSDNTHRDVKLNFDGVVNVYKGTYTRIDGTVISGKSIEDLLIAKNPSKATEISNNITEIYNDLSSTTIPFDWSIMHEAAKWNEVVSGLQTLGDDLAFTANELGVGTFEVVAP